MLWNTCITFLFIISICTALAAQTIVFDTSLPEKAVKGIVNVTSSIISDSFTPMTHYDRGDWIVTAVPAYFEIDRVFDDPDLRGNDLKGWAAGIGGGYAISDRLMTYCVITAMNIDGTIEAPDYGSRFFDSEYTLVATSAGAGFDLVPGAGMFSIPVYFGGSLQYYNADISMSPVESMYAYPLEAAIDGSGVTAALTAGIAVSAQLFSLLRITPYFLYMYGLNTPTMTAHVSQRTGPVSVLTQDIDIPCDRVRAGMAGLSITLLSGRSWSVSANAGGYLTSSTGYYNEHFLDGLKMKSIVLAFSYRGGNTAESE